MAASMPVASSVSSSQNKPAVLLVIAGPAGSGKTTLCERMVSETGAFSRVVTATTRPPRKGEVNGVHYHFLSPEEFDALLAQGAFLEWAWVHQTHRYGTLAKAVIGPLEQGRSLLINIDVQGVASFERAAKDNETLRRCMTTIFIDVPEDELRKRLAMRDTDGAEEVERRMHTARMEAREKNKFDFLIESRDRERDFQALLDIWEKAKLRTASRS
jgi:guanylate kinase